MTRKHLAGTAWALGAALLLLARCDDPRRYALSTSDDAGGGMGGEGTGTGGTGGSLAGNGGSGGIGGAGGGAGGMLGGRGGAGGGAGGTLGGRGGAGGGVGGTAGITTGAGGTSSGVGGGFGGTAGVTTGVGGGVGGSAGSGGAGGTTTSCSGSPDMNCTSTLAKTGQTCTVDCCLPCGYQGLGQKVCTCSAGVYTMCPCPRPAAYLGAATAPYCPGDGMTANIKNMPCTTEWQQCIGTDPVSGATPEGCVCLRNALTNTLQWVCGTTNKWFALQ
jgi:hypothetical protein